MDLIIAGDQDVKEWASGSKSIESIERLPGDASTRRYYRVRAGEDSYIVMKTDPFVAEGENYPFLEVQRHLAGAGVDVPQVHDVDSERGFALLEDLGDVTLLKRLQSVTDVEVERGLYQKVIDSLVRLHVSAGPSSAQKPVAGFALSFDHEKLMWEVNFTIEHFYRLHLERQISERDLGIMTESFSAICAELAAEPTVFTHRDFHSRNVMVVPAGELSQRGKADDRLVMIDFQDARMGPPQYDLASLLRDSYYQLSEEQVARLIDYYLARYEALSGAKLQSQKFARLFDLMSVQRNFKAIGSFASFLNKRGIATYLKYVGNTFENIRRTLLRHPEFSELREVLFHYYYF
ncbi:MAG: phosphotransferase [Bdellovibrionales bacterium]|nr:phosphotransferase [Bdellovibrionales bacterium]